MATTEKLFAGKAIYNRGRLVKLEFSDKALERIFRAAVKEEARKMLKPMQAFVAQLSEDAGFVTNHIKFGYAEKRNAEWGETFLKVINDMSDTILDDAESEEILNKAEAGAGLDYSKQKIDDAVKAAVGEYFVPWETRYSQAKEWIARW